eukprot:COSAG06_NODE_2006_length_7860_cov_11.608040_5_plen_62_part_00
MDSKGLLGCRYQIVVEGELVAPRHWLNTATAQTTTIQTTTVHIPVILTFSVSLMVASSVSW